MRRSSRRLTITGASVFSASTPVVSQNGGSGSGSPKWVSAEEALTFKTPKFTRLTRRTTITRQNIFEEEADENSDEGFRRPTLMLVSPPGMKTRSRRSSMYVGKPNDQSNNNITTASKEPPAKIRKVNNVGTKDENNYVEKAKIAVKKTNENFPSPHLEVKDQDAFSFTNGKPGLKRPVENTDITLSSHKKLSPSVDAKVTVTDVKKVRKSGRHHVESLDVEISKNTTVSLQDIQTPWRNTRQNDAQLQKSNGSYEVESKSIEQLSKMRSQIPENNSLGHVEKDKDTIELKESDKKTPKPDTLSTKDKDKIEWKESAKAIKTPKPDSLSTPGVKSASLKRTKQFTPEKDEIDAVVKKMFSPSSFYSRSTKSLKSSSKFTSPNTMKSVSSPARAAIVRETLTAPKSESKCPGRKHLESSFTKKTPSRAAPKARKILGVATPSNIGNLRNEQKERRENVEASHLIRDESMTSSSKTEEKISFEAEDENNVTLSHTSHSQWCTIL